MISVRDLDPASSRIYESAEVQYAGEPSLVGENLHFEDERGVCRRGLLSYDHFGSEISNDSLLHHLGL